MGQILQQLLAQIWGQIWGQFLGQFGGQFLGQFLGHVYLQFRCQFNLNNLLNFSVKSYYSVWFLEPFIYFHFSMQKKKKHVTNIYFTTHSASVRTQH